MKFHYIPDMMPISDDIVFNTRNSIKHIGDDSPYGIINCSIVDNFIEITAIGHQHYYYSMMLSPIYELLSLKTTASYNRSKDIIVINKNTGDIHILLQQSKIFLFDCPDDLWLLFQAVLMTTTKQDYYYTHLSSEYVENNRFSLSKIDNSKIASYIVKTLVNDGVLKLA